MANEPNLIHTKFHGIKGRLDLIKHNPACFSSKMQLDQNLQGQHRRTQHNFALYRTHDTLS